MELFHFLSYLFVVVLGWSILGIVGAFLLTFSRDKVLRSDFDFRFPSVFFAALFFGGVLFFGAVFILFIEFLTVDEYF